MTSTTMNPTQATMNAARPSPRRIKALPALGAIAAALLLAGCAVTPKLVTEDEVKNRVAADAARQIQAPGR